ncbi:MAG: hypothetical protein P1V18_04695 [Candidatus Gracilibacteria bacterium]|nr:hypothetical protein [Candidatus Gracilibacteria bacterium]
MNSSFSSHDPLIITHENKSDFRGHNQSDNDLEIRAYPEVLKQLKADIRKRIYPTGLQQLKKLLDDAGLDTQKFDLMIEKLRNVEFQTEDANKVDSVPVLTSFSYEAKLVPLTPDQEDALVTMANSLASLQNVSCEAKQLKKHWKAAHRKVSSQSDSIMRMCQLVHECQKSVYKELGKTGEEVEKYWDVPTLLGPIVLQDILQIKNTVKRNWILLYRVLPAFVVVLLVLLLSVNTALNIQHRREERRKLADQKSREILGKSVESFRERILKQAFSTSSSSENMSGFAVSFSSPPVHNTTYGHMYSFHHDDEGYCTKGVSPNLISPSRVKSKFKNLESAILNETATILHSLSDENSVLAITKDSDALMSAALQLSCKKSTDDFYGLVEPHVLEMSVFVVGFDGDHYSVLVPTPDGEEYVSFFLPLRDIEQNAQIGYQDANENRIVFLDLELEEYPKSFSLPKNMTGSHLPGKMKEILSRFPSILKKYYQTALEKGLHRPRQFGFITNASEYRDLLTETPEGKHVEILQEDFESLTEVAFQHYSISGRHNALRIKNKNIWLELNNLLKKTPVISREKYFEYWDRCRKVLAAKKMMSYPKDLLKDVFLPVSKISNDAKKAPVFQEYSGEGRNIELINTAVEHSLSSAKPVFYYRKHSEKQPQLIAGTLSEALEFEKDSRYLAFESVVNDSVDDKEFSVLEFYRHGKILFVITEKKDIKNPQEEGVIAVYVPNSDGELEWKAYIQYSVKPSLDFPQNSDLAYSWNYEGKSFSSEAHISRPMKPLVYLSSDVLTSLQRFRIIPVY